jgi:hypothetical protein
MSEFPYEEAAMPYNPGESAASDSASSSPIVAVKQNHERELMAIDGVEGVGVGRNQIGDEVILVYLRDEEVKKRIPPNIAGFQVETQITGIIDALSG